MISTGEKNKVVLAPGYRRGAEVDPGSGAFMCRDNKDR